MMIVHSFDLFSFLHSLHLLDHSPLWWWPNAGDFEVVVGAILTQNTRWNNVEKSLQNLYAHRILLPHQNEENLRNLSACNPLELASLIVPSGFANQKSPRLIALSQNIMQEFGDFSTFVQQVEPQWLLSQKGIGKESRDCILNYCCLREVMVIDRYTYKLLCLYGFTLQDYDEIQEWITQGINQYFDKIIELYPYAISLAQVYARFHGKIVEFAKKGFKT